MSMYTLFQDLAELMTIVDDHGQGWPGAYWSTSLFVTDARAITHGLQQELDRPTPGWKARLEEPHLIAVWCSKTGKLSILDAEPGQRAARYLGLNYDEARWVGLDPAAFRAAIMGAASCSLSSSTAASALVEASAEQLEHLSASDLSVLLQHEREDVRQAAIRIFPRVSRSETPARRMC